MNETNKECSACENKDASMHTCRKYRSGTPQETNKEWDEEKMKIIVPMYIQLIKKRDDIYCNELRYIIEKYENIPVLLSQKDTEWKERVEKAMKKTFYPTGYANKDYFELLKYLETQLKQNLGL